MAKWTFVIVGNLGSLGLMLCCVIVKMLVHKIPVLCQTQMKGNTCHDIVGVVLSK